MQHQQQLLLGSAISALQCGAVCRMQARGKDLLQQTLLQRQRVCQRLLMAVQCCR
jgi:hypothetical protein